MNNDYADKFDAVDWVFYVEGTDGGGGGGNNGGGGVAEEATAEAAEIPPVRDRLLFRMTRFH